MQNEPTPAQLALIAAATQIKEPKEALERARSLLDAAQRDEEQKLWADIPRPKFPATLDDFLNQVVRAKTPADSEKRLRDFYRAEQAQFLSKGRDKGLSYDEQLAKLGEPIVKHTGKFILKDGKKTELLRTINPSVAARNLIERHAVNQIKGWRANGFKSDKPWLALAERYLAWWELHKSAQAKNAASKRIRKGRKKSLGAV